MAEDMDNQCEEDDAGDRIVRIPAIRRYKLDCLWNAIRQVEGGPWVRYDDHVAAVKLMRSEIEKLEEQVAELDESLWDARIESKSF